MYMRVKQANMGNYKACYRLYVDYFKVTFQYTALSIYEEWTIYPGVEIDTDNKVRSFLRFSGNMES